jgi:hypothetical protein
MPKFDKIIVKIGGKNKELLEKPLADALFMNKSGGEFTGAVISTSTISASGGFFQESDKRLKENLENVEVSLEDLYKLSIIYFNYIYDSTNKTKRLGVIADEIKEVCPEIVIEDEDGYLEVDYSKLSVLALKGIQLLYDKQFDMMMDIQKIKSKLNID